MLELCANTAHEGYVTMGDIGASPYEVAELPVEELPFDIPRD